MGQRLVKVKSRDKDGQPYPCFFDFEEYNKLKGLGKNSPVLLGLFLGHQSVLLSMSLRTSHLLYLTYLG